MIKKLSLNMFALMVVFLLYGCGSQNCNTSFGPVGPAPAPVTHAFSVTVMDVTGAVIPGATIELTGPVNMVVQADANGFYEFRNLPQGIYHIHATMTGYDVFDQDIAISDADKSENIILTKGIVEKQVRLAVVDQDNQPYTESTVHLTYNGKQAKGDITWVAGRNEYYTQKLPVGSYTLSIPGYSDETASFVVDENTDSVVVSLVRIEKNNFVIRFYEEGTTDPVFYKDYVSLNGVWMGQVMGGQGTANIKSFTFPKLSAGINTVYLFWGTPNSCLPYKLNFTSDMTSPMDIYVRSYTDFQYLRTEYDCIELVDESYVIKQNGSIIAENKLLSVGTSRAWMEFRGLAAGTYTFSIPDFSDEERTVAVPVFDPIEARFPIDTVSFARKQLPLKLKIYKPRNIDGTYEEITSGITARIVLQEDLADTLGFDDYPLTYSNGCWTTSDGRIAAGNHTLQVTSADYILNTKICICNDNTDKVAVVKNK